MTIDLIVPAARKCLVGPCRKPAEPRGWAGTCAAHPLPLPPFGIQAGHYAAFRSGPPAPVTAGTVLAAMRRLAERWDA